MGGAFVHERHVGDRSLPKLLGWWGQRPGIRFEMGTVFDPIATAESWQLSNPPILVMAALRASLDTFDRAGGMEPLRAKSARQIEYLDFLLTEMIGDRVETHHALPCWPNARASTRCGSACRASKAKPCTKAWRMPTSPATGGTRM